MKEIVPEVVFQGGEGYYSIDYSKLTPVLLAAMKEQHNTILDQQKQIDEIKAELEGLKARQDD